MYNADAKPNQSSDIKLLFLSIQSLLYSQFFRAVISNPTNTPGVFHVKMTWKRHVSHHFNVEYTWCVCRALHNFKKPSKIPQIKIKIAIRNKLDDDHNDDDDDDDDDDDE